MADITIVTEFGQLVLADPQKITFPNGFYKKIYSLVFSKIDSSNPYPQINFDDFIDPRKGGVDIERLATDHDIPIPKKDHKQKLMLSVLQVWPVLYAFFNNLNSDTLVTIQCAEEIIGEKTSSKNFIEVKRVVDLWNSKRWTREKDVSERQSGVSILGNISEHLLQSTFSDYLDDTHFFKNNISSVQSYGDFVLLCLPNNLWLSVKSNFARERLLASGFSTDIIGVGFFTDYKEFISSTKVRNFQKVGFLAMYVPDIAVTEKQNLEGTNTYDQVIKHYSDEGVSVPQNINGKPFIRKLSDVVFHLSELLDETDIKKRVTVNF